MKKILFTVVGALFVFQIMPALAIDVKPGYASFDGFCVEMLDQYGDVEKLEFDGLHGHPSIAVLSTYSVVFSRNVLLTKSAYRGSAEFMNVKKIAEFLRYKEDTYSFSGKKFYLSCQYAITGAMREPELLFGTGEGEDCVKCRIVTYDGNGRCVGLFDSEEENLSVYAPLGHPGQLTLSPDGTSNGGTGVNRLLSLDEWRIMLYDVKCVSGKDGGYCGMVVMPPQSAMYDARIPACLFEMLFDVFN